MTTPAYQSQGCHMLGSCLLSLNEYHVKELTQLAGHVCVFYKVTHALLSITITLFYLAFIVYL